MTTIKYITGDATHPIGDGHKLIIHVCNDVNAFGAGFVIAVGNRWPIVKQTFHSARLKLGDIQIVPVEPDITVINMVAQRGIGRRNGPPIRYEAVQACLKQVAEYAKQKGASIHAPRFGAGLAGGKWEIIESLIKSELCEKDIEVTIYDYVPAVTVPPVKDSNSITDI